MEQWSEIRRRVLTGEMSRRAACREYSVHWQTLEKMLSMPEPPGYRRKASKPRSKIDSHVPIIHEMLDSDKQSHKKQPHSAQRIFDRLKEEHGFTRGYTIVQDVLRHGKPAQVQSGRWRPQDMPSCTSWAVTLKAQQGNRTNTT